MHKPKEILDYYQSQKINVIYWRSKNNRHKNNRKFVECYVRHRIWWGPAEELERMLKRIFHAAETINDEKRHIKTSIIKNLYGGIIRLSQKK